MKIELVANEQYVSKMSHVGKLIYETFELEPKESIELSKSIMYDERVEITTEKNFTADEIDSINLLFLNSHVDVNWIHLPAD